MQNLARNTFTVEKVWWEKETSTLKYSYRYDQSLSKYFNASQPFYVKYPDVNLSNVPASILIIPFIAQLLPISWFANFDVIIEELDDVFFQAMPQLRSIMLSQHQVINGNKSELKVNRVKRNGNNTVSNKNLLLFSGGVDSITSYIKHFDTSPDIATVLGADIDTRNNVQWETLNSIIDRSVILAKAKKF